MGFRLMFEVRVRLRDETDLGNGYGTGFRVRFAVLCLGFGSRIG